MNNDFAVIHTGGKQYKVSAGQKIIVEKLEAKEGTIKFDTVLLRAVGGNVEIGAPYLTKATVEAKVLGELRGKKKIIFKYHSKTRRRKKKGHRQEHTELEIISI